MRVGVLALGAVLGGCAGSGERQARRRLAPYAVTTGPQAWSVTCPEGRVTSDFSDNAVFYDDNGVLKEWEQFCEEMQSSSHLRNRR